MRLADLKNKKVAIMGLGREGQTAVAVVRQAGAATIIGIDDQLGAAYEQFHQQFPEIPVKLSSDLLNDDSSSEVDIIIKSPGISKLHPLIRHSTEQGIRVTGSTQLWMSEHAHQTVAITGSKGKSTTTSLIAHLATEVLGWDSEFGGNIGITLFSLPESEHYIVELGSYQSFEVQQSPDTVIITSLFPEHLDWHGSIAEYYQDKLNLAAHGARRVILNARDERLKKAMREFYPEVNYEECGEGIGVEVVENGENGEQNFLYDGQFLFPASRVKLRGVHNLWNVALALTWLSQEVDIVDSRDRIAVALEKFLPLNHRLTAYESDGLTFVDDSLSTSPYATIAAVESFPDQPITLLLGGQDRGVDYQDLLKKLVEISDRVQAVVWLPGSGERFAELVRDSITVPTHHADTMQDAIEFCRALSASGSLVLLSPAAPSYGYFRDFADRAEQFVAAIHETASST